MIDISALTGFSAFILWLFVFILLYGVLLFAKPFGGATNGVYALFAAVIGLILMFSVDFLTFLIFTLPWFVIVFMILFFVLFFFKVLDPSLSAASAINNGGVRAAIIVPVVFIFIFGLSAVFSDARSSTTNVDVPEDTFVPYEEASETEFGTMDVLLHPQIIGVIILFVIVACAFFMLTF